MDLAQVVGIFFCIVLLWVLVTYNLFLRARAKVRVAWHGVEVQLKRRHEAVPRLNAAVRAVVGDEHDELRKAAAGRSQAIEAELPADVEAAENCLAGEIERVLVVAERYPDLLAGAGFANLGDSFAEIEAELQTARGRYNAKAATFNARATAFPNSLVTRWMRPNSFACVQFERIDFVEKAPRMRELTA